ncbi:MAG: hypothetical protein HC919_12145 [Oscillatoriales cyanobacterium SM2_2_1]|nr:hypothetical protein [Oscillatoriales cyanobacterium SM2_2_1]
MKRRGSIVLLLGLVMMVLVACGGDQSSPSAGMAAGTLTEVSPPTAIQRLSRLLERYEPRLEVLTPHPDQTVSATTVPVQIAVQGIPIGRDLELGLGSHVHVVLDRDDPRHVYDLAQPLLLEHLSPGTHTLRAFVVSPWQESFKNEESYAEVTFHVLTKTMENTPNPQQPLLTYNEPVGTYGAEPILLDFYLHNAPLHRADLTPSSPTDWQVHVTVNGDRFVLDQWQPVYLKGFHPGENWVKLEVRDRSGQLIPNVFNSTAHLVTYQPNGTDSLSRLIRDEAIAGIEKMIDPQLIPTATPEPELPTPAPSPEASVPSPEPMPVPASSPPTLSIEQPPQPESPMAEPTSEVPAPSAEPQGDTAPAIPVKEKRKPRIPLKPRVSPTPTESPTPEVIEIPAELSAPTVAPETP